MHNGKRSFAEEDHGKERECFTLQLSECAHSCAQTDSGIFVFISHENGLNGILVFFRIRAEDGIFVCMRTY